MDSWTQGEGVEVGEGDGGVTLSLKERAEKYRRQRAHDSSERPEGPWGISAPSGLSGSALVWECCLAGIEC